MPSKSDIQFGKIALKNHFAAKDEIEQSLKDQSRFERERHTTVLEAVLLAGDILDVPKIEAIQKAMKRRVIFCGKCSAKYNVFQFKGGDKFACNKCGSKVEVPDESGYRKILRHQAGEVAEVLNASTGETPPPAPEPEDVPHRETIMLSKEDIEAARSRPRKEVEAEPPDEVEVEEVELEAEVEEEQHEPEADQPSEEADIVPPAEPQPMPEPEPPEKETAGSPAPGKKPLRRIKLKPGAAPKKEEPAPAKEPPPKAPQGAPPRKIKLVKKADRGKKTR